MDDRDLDESTTQRLRAAVDALGEMAATSGEKFDPDETAASALVDLEAENAQLKIGLSTRAVIGQATGLLMRRYSLTADEAFDRLVKLSSHSNVKLRDVAATIVGEADARTRAAREAE